MLKPNHKSVKDYYAALAAYAGQYVEHEGAVSTAFQSLLNETGRRVGWTLIPQEPKKVNGTIKPDGTFKDDYYLTRGYWEAKDLHDDLEREIQKKIAKGYPLTNTIFEDTRRAFLYQNGEIALQARLDEKQSLCDLLNLFFDYKQPDIERFGEAVDEFQERVPDLAKGLVEKIADAHQHNKKFIAAFEKFFELCKSSLNPNLSQAAVDEMLVQHLLTERLIRTIFDQSDFVRKNVIAAEVEKVIDALTSQTFSRRDFLKSLDRFYTAIEAAAAGIASFSEKQHFLNTVYERFFQGYSVKVADTHGIVYTPQEIVDFMCASVAEVLETEFGLSLGSPSVHILDPCTGTGNFIVNLLRRIPKRDLARVYREQLFANEVMLLPYYIAALNIEHAYYELTGTYEPFDGLCFVDTLDMAEGAQRQFGFMTQENTVRVERQRKSPITVIIGNPPYNFKQLSENDNNKNRSYAELESRIRATYAKDSTATNKIPLNDAYVKFVRWATDRLGDRDGIVCLITNNSFVDQIAFDGMRRHLLTDFTEVYHLHLEGNVRQNPTLSGTAYNVFGIQVGVGITIAIRTSRTNRHSLRFARIDKSLRRSQKLAWIASQQSIAGTQWSQLIPDSAGRWLVSPSDGDFRRLIPLGTQEGKRKGAMSSDVVFKVFSNGVKTHRDQVVYDFDAKELASRVRHFADLYNAEVDRYGRNDSPEDVDAFVDYEQIKWSLGLKQCLRAQKSATFDASKIRTALYRPFCRRSLYFQPLFNDVVYQTPSLFPAGAENTVLCVSGVGSERPFATFATMVVPDLNFFGPGTVPQWFPFYVYDEDGTNRRENVTDWALETFRAAHGDESITKWDIFYYVYGLLHHPLYRAKFADNLKRELPRIPIAPVPSPPSSGERDRVRGSASSAAEASQPPALERRKSASRKTGRPKESHPHPLPKGEGTREGTREPYPSALASGAGEDPLTLTLSPEDGGEGTRDKTLSREDGGEGTEERGKGFWAFSSAGKRLAELHLKYEELAPWPLEWIETPGVPLSYRVEKMKLAKDKRSLKVNESLTLAGIPPAVFEYRLGNRSALEWVIDQYRVKTDERSGISSDPNREDDPEYIVRLVGQVVRVSLETVEIVNGLPAEYA